MKKNYGFGLVHTIAGLAVVAIIIVAGVLVANHNNKKISNSNSSSNNTNSKSQTSSNTSNQQTAQNYLVVKELGIRFKLSDNISSAYYQAKTSSKNGKPIIALYLHSLDSYSQCTPANNGDGVALISTYTPGYTDQVVGDYSTSYPNAPLIDGLHYYIANEQYDCSGGQNKNMPAISQAFTAAYPTIEAYSGN